MQPSTPSSSTSSFCYVEIPPPSPRFPSLSWPPFLRRKQPSRTEHEHPTPPLADVPDTHGIHIQFPPEHRHSQTSRKQRLVHLQQTIRVAVQDAGMCGSPGNVAHPEMHHRTRGYKTADALFSGTYGQLMAALEGAGLSAVPCAGEALSEYTRLGALFVARNDVSGVQLRKITLWG